MTENLLSRVHQNTVRLLEEEVESWKAEHNHAMLVRGVEDALRLCRNFPAALRTAWDSLFVRARAGQIEDYHATGMTLQELFSHTLGILDTLRQWARLLEGEGYQVESVAELDRDIEEVRRFQEEIFAAWPDFREQDVHEGLAERARGECLELDEAFASLAGVDKDAWLRRLEERRRPFDAGGRVGAP